MEGVVVARAGFEPATFHFSGERCYQLSYLAKTEHTQTTLKTKAVTPQERDDSPLSRPRRDSNPRPPP